MNASAERPLKALLRFLRALPLLCFLLIGAPVLLAIAAVALAATDLAWLVAGRRQKPVNTRPDSRAASLVIPNWNGKDLLVHSGPEGGGTQVQGQSQIGCGPFHEIDDGPHRRPKSCCIFCKPGLFEPG